MLDQRRMAQVKPGMPAAQALQTLGTPSATSTVGGDAWYYVSQRTERQLAFMPEKITDQHVLAVYFDKERKIQRIADYSLRDGKLIDFNTRQTPTPGDRVQSRARHDGRRFQRFEPLAVLGRVRIDLDFPQFSRASPRITLRGPPTRGQSPRRA